MTATNGMIPNTCTSTDSVVRQSPRRLATYGPVWLAQDCSISRAGTLIAPSLYTLCLHCRKQLKTYLRRLICSSDVQKHCKALWQRLRAHFDTGGLTDIMILPGFSA
jgi:hypothetical protein